MGKYDDLLEEVRSRAVAYMSTAKIYIPKMYNALMNESKDISPEDARDRIEKDCFGIWAKRTILDALPDEAKNQEEQKSGRLGQKKRNFAAVSAAPEAGAAKIILDTNGRSIDESSTIKKSSEDRSNGDPAKKYVIVLWDHGSGINGFGQDKQFNNDKLDISELEKAFTDANIRTNKNFELIGFDSCLMASIEVANSIKSFGSYMVASEEVEPPWGWDYTAILRSLINYPSQRGSDLGIKIADSFNKSSTVSAAKFQNFDSQREITLSVIDLMKIPRVIRDIETLASSLKDNLTNTDAAISLIRSADMSERYGETAHGGTGMTDIYDLVSDIEENFPHSSESINILKQSLKAAVVYEINGESKPHATGISMYSPISKQELTDSMVFSIGSWRELVNVQSNLTSNPYFVPTLKTYYDGQSIRGYIYNYTQQISKVNVYLRPDSSKSNMIYSQGLDPSTLIYSNGTFDYKQNNKILSLCNQDRICKLTSADFEFTKDKKYALIPVRLKSEIDNINKNVSLAYELTKDGKFIFLGASLEVNPTETISKEKYPLYPTDVIYTQGYDLSTTANQLNSSDVDSIQVLNPNTFTPKYIGYNGTLDLSFSLCDFSDNCAASSWYNLANIKYSPILKDVRSYFDGFDVQASKDIFDKNTSENLITYVNPANKFRVQHPTNWTVVSRMDPLTLQLVPTQNYMASLQLITGYWPFEESPKLMANFLDIEKGSPFSFNKLIESSETKIGVNNAYKILFSGISEKQKFIGIRIATVIQHRMLAIFYICDQSKFFKLLPLVQKMVKSFTFLSEEQINYLYSVRQSGEYVYKGLNQPTLTFYTDNNPFYRYKIQYPSEWNLIVSQNGLTVYIRPSVLSTFDVDDKHVLLIIAIIPNKNNMTLATFTLMGKSRIAHNLIGSNNITLNNTTISGQHATVYTLEDFNAVLRRTLKHLTTITTIGNNFCVVDFNAPLPVFQKYIPIIKKMINSFHIMPSMYTYTK